jgi:hypothetical protein
MTSGYIGYEHRWHRAFASSATYGIVSVDNLDVQTGDALHRTQRVSANIMWNPIPRADLIFEVLAGERTNKDGQHGTSTQLQAGWKVRF